MRQVNLKLKRVFDIILSGFILLVTLPFFLITILIQQIVMPGPVFFQQQRVGKDGKLFYILKLRSMKVDREAEKNHDFSKDEERLTSFGRFMRRSKVDELPQVWNIFRGDMSLIGPRPTVKEQVDQYTEFQMQRLLMRPGLSGLAQVNGNTAISWAERIEYDVDYIEQFSIILDAKIMLKTLLVILFGEDKFRKSRHQQQREA